MDFGSAMSQIAVEGGRAQIAGVEQAQRVANVEDTRAQTQLRQMQALAMKQEMTDKADAATDLKAGMSTVQGGIKTQEDIIKGATATMNIAAQKGRYSEVKAMEDLIKGAQTEIKATTDAVAADRQAKAEDAGRTALSYQENPTPAAAAEVVRKAIAAGVPVEEIPPSTDKKSFDRWVDSLPGKARSVEKATEYKQAKDKAEADRIEKAREADQREKNHLLQIQATAAAQANADATRRLAIATVAASKAAADEARAERQAARDAEKAKGLQLTAKQKDTSDAVAGMAHEGYRTLHGFNQMLAGTTAGAFQDLNAHTIVDSLMKVGGNVITPQDQQMFQTNAAGFGRAVLSAETAGIGRSPTAAQIIDMQRAVVPQEGDDYYTAAYKIATGNAIILNRLETRHTNPDPKVEARLVADEEYMRSLATPEMIYNAAQKDPKGKRSLDKRIKTTENLLADIKGGGFRNKMVPDAAAKGGLPEGFKED